MPERADVVVVGAGVGGLAAAIRVAATGRRVVVLERNDVVGGKLASVRHGGATFDVGPSLVTLPHVLDDLFRAAGTSLPEELPMARLDPQFHYHWPDGSALVVPDDADARVEAFESFRRGAGAAWRRFDAHGRRIWEVAERTFLAGPMSGPLTLAHRMRSPRDVFAIDPVRSLHRVASSFFDDPRLVQWRVGTRRTRGRLRSAPRPRWRASRMSRLASAAGTPMEVSTSCGRRWHASRPAWVCRCARVSPSSGSSSDPARSRGWRPSKAASPHPWSSRTPTPIRSTATCCPTSGPCAGFDVLPGR